jgi:hypothetical protein
MAIPTGQPSVQLVNGSFTSLNLCQKTAPPNNANGSQILTPKTFLSESVDSLRSPFPGKRRLRKDSDHEHNLELVERLLVHDLVWFHRPDLNRIETVYHFARRAALGETGGHRLWFGLLSAIACWRVAPQLRSMVNDPFFFVKMMLISGLPIFLAGSYLKAAGYLESALLTFTVCLGLCWINARRLTKSPRVRNRY